jgi:hypothetical protein
LGSCHGLTEPAKESPPRLPHGSQPKGDEALAALAEAARVLAQRLERLDNEALQRLQQMLGATDRFRRSYGEDYVKSLRFELRRVTDIGKPPETTDSTTTREPTVTEDACRFVLRAADAFGDCFELPPSAQPDAPFVTALVAISAATGLRIPTDRPTVARILGDA